MSANQITPIAKSSGPRHPSPEDLTLYAMQLLPLDEAAVIAQHLDACQECRAELARIVSDLATLALTVEPETPPPSSRERLLKQVAREKKIVSVEHTAQQPTPSVAPFGRSSSLLTSDVPLPRPTNRRPVLAWSGWAVAAGLAVAVSFLYGDRVALHNNLAAENGQIQRLNTEATSSHKLLDALTDPTAMRVTLTTKPLPKAGPIGGVTYNPKKGTLVFLASNLDPLQSYKTYELWVIPANGSAPLPAGTFHPDDQGNASVVMPPLPQGVAAKAFGVTIEDAGGSQTPTLPIIMAGS